MTRGPFSNGNDKGGPPGAPDDAASRRLTPAVGHITQPAEPPPDGPQSEPQRSLVIAIPAEHSVAVERLAIPAPSGGREADVVIACAGQPKDIAAFHTHLRNAQFLIAPEETSGEDLRVLAFFQANGDIVSFTTGTRARTSGPHPMRSPTRVAAVLPDIAISVVVPVHNGGRTLADTLAQIRASTLPREAYELIVVDDASSDGSQAVAARHADVLVRLSGRPRGAAYARNRGAEQARGAIVVFVDADVGVREDTLSLLLAAFDDSDVVAASAVNDGTGHRGRFTAEYWNLLHAYGATRYASTLAQFHASCGAVRRDEFMHAGMFNEWLFRLPSVEDVEMAERLRASGKRVRVERDVAFAHRAGGGLGAVLGAVWRLSVHKSRTLGWRATRETAPGHVVHTLTRAELGLFGFWVQRRGLAFALAATPLHLLVKLVAAGGLLSGWVLRGMVGEPAPDAATQAFAEVGVEMWPPVPRRR
ncbi:MAG TPA: glycosyltransferase family 2 protein [Gemmatimonadaceae bacterium]|nr:glycosyltransferase family 2 protein [Gemmatimonadaceae bacterium]